MKNSTRWNLRLFNRNNTIHDFLMRIQLYLFERDYGHNLWMSTPNFYKERDLGIQEVCGQKVHCKKVIDTTGMSFFIVADEFDFS